MDYFGLTNKVAIITGASKGLGAAIARRLAHEGVIMCLNGRNEASLEEVAVACQSASPKKIKPLVVIGDITDEDVRQAIFDRTLQKFKRLDILVNNAGMMELGTTQQTTLEDFDVTFNINFRVPYDMCRRSIPHLVESKGCIVNMSSIVSVRPNMLTTAYCISKAALDQLTNCLAQELGKKAVRVVSINPAVIKTDMWKLSGMSDEESEKFMQNFASSHALERIGEPDEVAKAVVFLASGAASFITGSKLLVDGGCFTMPPGK